MKRRRRRKSRIVDRETVPTKLGASPDLINGRAMMTVSILYESITGRGLDHADSRGLPYLRTFLKDYKKYQNDVRRCIAGTYDVLVEDNEPVDPEHVRLIKKTIKEEMEYIWGKKQRPKTEPVPPVPESEEVEEGVDVEEEIDWEARFADGEFDLE